MAEIIGHFLAVDHGPNGVGFEVALCGRNLGRLFAITYRPTHEAALQEAAAEAERRGGLEIVDMLAVNA
ncbi:MAG: hypothetical protein Q7J32_17570 [Sphingomonadaceae bacterium]|nr:hypothetical protein [Sphingomonadaceae bacterium]